MCLLKKTSERYLSFFPWNYCSLDSSDITVSRICFVSMYYVPDTVLSPQYPCQALDDLIKHGQLKRRLFLPLIVQVRTREPPPIPSTHLGEHAGRCFFCGVDQLCSRCLAWCGRTRADRSPHCPWEGGLQPGGSGGSLTAQCHCPVNARIENRVQGHPPGPAPSLSFWAICL